MSPFDRIVVIFNPHSTGEAAGSAEQLHAELARRLPDVPVALCPTQRAGHARELAREAAATGRPLLVSVSGDGGYNEVVDGVMQAGNPDAVCAVRAAGNANDHRRTTRQHHLADAIVAGDVRRIDLLRLTLGSGADAQVRYAHSYIGVGVTPVIAVDLEKGGKGSWREALSVIRGFTRFRPFPIRMEDGEERTVDSLLFANIAQMAKVARLSDGARPDDGRFEVIAQRRTGKLQVLATALRAATRGLGRQPSVTHYAFTTLAPMPLQLDGELVELEADTEISVDIAPRALATVF
ncbi:MULTISPECIES: diacylglycerol/lipid kinase family protein [unclassified Modestobacter]|uniref:diacylglycerol/lipid kinase family protein n=1 Tax=unclassified Modestobacter TaxID=2643866 RepID=UPI0022AB07AC|nr:MULTISPECIES: diacylglycerol kinase family protein [unclassified Modestobacter]MCZ2825068.1 diacylglycerol kinase family protein [Modestobacter sp. VKM Ac-2981]MCZ2854429.1 diacylglycerol kinase family protein [Modestobacter sp. VKM Ac-2982]